MANVKIKESRGDRVFDAINTALMTLLMLIILYPLIFIVSASISNPDYVNMGKVVLWPKGFTLEGYIRVFQDKEILLGYGNTLLYTVGGTIINLFLTLTAAYPLAKRGLKGRGAITLIFTFTMYFSGGMIPTYMLVKNLGLMNTRFVLMIIAGVSTSNLIICRTFFVNGVPLELEEAAFIDGCSPIGAFIKIVLPLSRALMGVMVLYYGVAHWNSWFSALIYLTDRSKVPLQLVLREILIDQQTKASMMESNGYVDELLLDAAVRVAALIRFAVIIVSSLPVLIIYPFLQKYFDKGVMIGSLKG